MEICTPTVSNHDAGVCLRPWILGVFLVHDRVLGAAGRADPSGSCRGKTGTSFSVRGPTTVRRSICRVMTAATVGTRGHFRIVAIRGTLETGYSELRAGCTQHRRKYAHPKEKGPGIRAFKGGAEGTRTPFFFLEQSAIRGIKRF